MGSDILDFPGHGPGAKSFVFYLYFIFYFYFLGGKSQVGGGNLFVFYLHFPLPRQSQVEGGPQRPPCT